MNTKNVGIVGTVISGFLLLFGIYKYNYCMSLYKASGYLTTIWKNRANNYKIMIIACSITLLISIILLISSMLKNINAHLTQAPSSTQAKLQELDHIYKNNLITKEEYENKKKEILDRM